MSLNKSQCLAVDHFRGPLLVLAGPGSGKTTVIVNRIDNLIRKYGISGKKILVVTFTKATAKEMKQRFIRGTKSLDSDVCFETFHALFFAILREELHYHVSSIIREQQQVEIIRQVLCRMHRYESDEINSMIIGILKDISEYKNTADDRDRFIPYTLSEEDFYPVYNEYCRKVESEKLIDFDDMQLKCLDLLRNNKSILQKWREKYSFTLIDEYQDINKLQHDIIKLLVEGENNIFAVGDDDQSIYSFRGARPELMLAFEKEYTDAKVMYLDVNYRCSNEIWKAADKLIRNNTIRYSKDISTVNDDGEVSIKSFHNQEEAGRYILEDINKDIHNGIGINNIAVLYRTNTDPIWLSMMCLRNHISINIKDSMPNIYESKEARDILSYIHIAMGQGKREDYLRIINKPWRGIEREALGNNDVSIDSIIEYYKNISYMEEKIYKLKNDIMLMTMLNPYSAINYIRNGIGYGDDTNTDILDTIMNSAKNCTTYEEWINYIDLYSNKIRVKKAYHKKDNDGIVFQTFHSSKGLEYEEVYIIGAYDGNIPYIKKERNANIEEERRLMYVGMTRAKRKLTIMYVAEKHGREYEPSRFLHEII